MDREQKKALEKYNRLIGTEYSTWIGTANQKAIEKVLNMLKEKDIQINSKNGAINALQCALKERTRERDSKDNIIMKQNKIIDLMLDDLNVNGYPKEELYNSYKYRADAILKEE